MDELDPAERLARLRVAVTQAATGPVRCIEEPAPSEPGGRVFRTWTYVGRGTRLEAVGATAVGVTEDLLGQIRRYRRRRR